MNIAKSLRRERQQSKKTKFREYEPSNKNGKHRNRKKGTQIKEKLLIELTEDKSDDVEDWSNLEE